MKKQYWIIIIVGVSAALAINSILPLLDNEDRHEWLGTELYQFVLLIGWGVFFFVTHLCGVAFRTSRYGSHYLQFRRMFRVSMLTIVPIVLIGIIRYKVDFNRWSDESHARQVRHEKAEAEKFKSTLDSLSAIIASDSSLADPFYQLGLAYRHRGNWEESVKNYKSAIALDQTKSNYFSELGYSESTLGQYAEASKSYEKAYELDSSRKWILDEIRRCHNLEVQHH